MKNSFRLSSYSSDSSKRSKRFDLRTHRNIKSKDRFSTTSLGFDPNNNKYLKNVFKLTNDKFVSRRF